MVDEDDSADTAPTANEAAPVENAVLCASFENIFGTRLRTMSRVLRSQKMRVLWTLLQLCNLTQDFWDSVSFIFLHYSANSVDSSDQQRVPIDILIENRQPQRTTSKGCKLDRGSIEIDRMELT